MDCGLGLGDFCGAHRAGLPGRVLDKDLSDGCVRIGLRRGRKMGPEEKEKGMAWMLDLVMCGNCRGHLRR